MGRLAKIAEDLIVVVAGVALAGGVRPEWFWWPMSQAWWWWWIVATAAIITVGDIFGEREGVRG